MAYYRKNKRRFDPRYFMNERMEEELEEIQLSDSEADMRRPPEDEEDTPWAREKAFHPETIRQRLEKAFAEKALEDEDEAVHHIAAAEEEAEEYARISNLEEGCGDVEELPWVEMDGGKLTAASEDDLDSILNTAEIWQRGGIEIINGRADILDALGIEVPASESLPSLMDEEPPLEE